VNRAQKEISTKEILEASDILGNIYSHYPSVLLWRCWEYAAYRQQALMEPVLDVGCGDGLFFRMVWPEIQNAVALDFEPGPGKLAKSSGRYREVVISPAQNLPFASDSFGSIFANCSLEHMDNVQVVFGEIWRCLRPQGIFLFSVVTDNLLRWDPLPAIFRLVGAPDIAMRVEKDYTEYHHLVNPWSPSQWIDALRNAGFQVEEYTPIVPELTGRFFLFLDHLWHVRTAEGEFGSDLHHYIGGLPNFLQGFKKILQGLLEMETNFNNCCGAVIAARKSMRDS
jgi:SAM-dependent methyltransferase